MVCYSMHLEMHSVEFVKGKLTSSGYQNPHELFVKVRFTYPFQEDGRAPSHGDRTRSFVEAIVSNIPQEPIIAILQANGIESLERGSFPQVSFSKTDEFYDVFGMEELKEPIYEMEIKFRFYQKDKYKMATQALLNAVRWEDSKKAILEMQE